MNIYQVINEFIYLIIDKLENKEDISGIKFAQIIMNKANCDFRHQCYCASIIAEQLWSIEMLNGKRIVTKCLIR